MKLLLLPTLTILALFSTSNGRLLKGLKNGDGARCKYHRVVLEGPKDSPKYKCGNEEYSQTELLLPEVVDGSGSPSEKFPVLFFYHGAWGLWPEGTADQYNKMLESVAEQCVIVIAPATGHMKNTKECYDLEDIGIAYNWFKNWKDWQNQDGKTYEPNWNEMGFLGNSAGAKHIPRFLATPIGKAMAPHVHAVGLSHGGADIERKTANKLTGIASLWVTAADDHKVEARDMDKWMHMARSKHPSYGSDQQVFISNKEGGHDEHHHQNAITNMWIGRFFGCHLAQSRELCIMLYDKSNDEYVCGSKYSSNWGDYYNENGDVVKDTACQTFGSLP